MLLLAVINVERHHKTDISRVRELLAVNKDNEIVQAFKNFKIIVRKVY